MGRSSPLFGDYRNPIIISLMIIITKYEIYKKKKKNDIVTLPQILLQMKRQLNLEEYLAVTHKKSSTCTFLGKWSSIYNTLKGLKPVSYVKKRLSIICKL